MTPVWYVWEMTFHYLKLHFFKKNRLTEFRTNLLNDPSAESSVCRVIPRCRVDPTQLRHPSDLWYPHTKPEVSVLQGTCCQWSTYQIPGKWMANPFFPLTLSDICPASLSAPSSCIALERIAFGWLSHRVSFPPSSHVPHMNKWVSRMCCLNLFRFPVGHLVEKSI